jgi:hypothetical protein
MAVGKSFAEETAEKAEKMTKKSEKSENAEEAVETVSEVAERKEEQVLQKRASKSSMKALALSEVKENSKLSSDEPSGSPSVSRYSVARPHHIPKVESLSKKLDQIRSEMGEEVCVFVFHFSPSVGIDTKLECFRETFEEVRREVELLM